MYDEGTIMEFGAVAEAILCNPAFNRLHEAYDRYLVDQMLATKPEQAKEREAIFVQINATREFLGFMQNFVIKSRELTEAPQQAAMDRLDDPAVHDIYGE